MSTELASPCGSDSSAVLGPIAELVACLRDSSGSHINGLYDKRAADELERLAELADSEGTRAVEYLRRARKAEAKCEMLELNLDTVRHELAKVNNEFGSETPDWPDAWKRVAELKDRLGHYWQRNEEMRAALTVVVDDWTQQFERNGHLAPAWVKQARAALGPNVGVEAPTTAPRKDEDGTD